MRVSGRSEEAIRKSMLLPAGEYEARVVGVSNKPSNSGAEMITLTLQIINENGKSFLVIDRFVASMELKVLSAAQAFGLMEKYNAQDIDAEDFSGKAAIAAIEIEEASGKYPAKNVVAYYLSNKGEAALVKRSTSTQETTSSLDKFLNDEVPF